LFLAEEIVAIIIKKKKRKKKNRSMEVAVVNESQRWEQYINK
jgi:hypothetical protein